MASAYVGWAVITSITFHWPYRDNFSSTCTLIGDNRARWTYRTGVFLVLTALWVLHAFWLPLQSLGVPFLFYGSLGKPDTPFLTICWIIHYVRLSGYDMDIEEME